MKLLVGSSVNCKKGEKMSMNIENNGRQVTELEVRKAIAVSFPLMRAVKFTPDVDSTTVNIFPCLSQCLLDALRINGQKGMWDGRFAQFLLYLIAKFALMSPPDSQPDEIEKNTLIVFKNSEVAKVFGITPQFARKLICESCDILQTLDLKFQDCSPTAGMVDISISPVESRVDVNKFGYSGVRLNKEFAHYLAHAYIPYLPIEIFTITPKYNPSALSFAIELLSNYNMNHKTPQQNLVPVDSLLSVACQMPKYEDIVKVEGPSRRIIKPFIRDINVLKELGVISDWCFMWKHIGEKVDMKSKDVTYNNFYYFNVYYKI